MNKTVLIGIAVLIVLGVSGYYFYNSQKQQSPEETLETTPSQTSVPSAMESSDKNVATDNAVMGSVKEFTVEGENFKFTPDKIEVKKGDKVKITFKNISGFHDFVIEGLNVNTKQIKAGEKDSVEFTADKVGSFEFYCSVGSHRSMGMKGTLVVN